MQGQWWSSLYFLYLRLTRCATRGRMEVRQKQGRNAEPSAAIIDSQSIKTSAVRGPEKGYDAGEKNRQGKRAD
jgi:hypothetical protein